MQFAYAEWENRKTYDNMVRRRRRFGDAQCRCTPIEDFTAPARDRKVGLFLTRWISR